MTHSSKNEPTSQDYQLASNGHFTIKNYGLKKPFSNFLPGIAGIYGTPLWVFYVNRGQGVVSFGTRDKDNAILEFFPANKAYQMAPSVGFRTFIKIKNGVHTSFYEPFRHGHGHSSDQNMEISSYELTLHERKPSAGLETTVSYFTLPGEPLAALVRELTLTNTSSHPQELEVLDGLPQVNPYGMNEFFMKNMSRTIEAWMKAENMDKKAPFLRLKVDAADRPEVTFIEGGNFYFALAEDRVGKASLLDPCVDPALIFGPALDFSEPAAFREGTVFHPSRQICENRTPCAFSHALVRLAAGKSKTIRSVFGHARSIEVLNRYLARAKKRGYFAEKRQENMRLIESIKTPLFSVTSSPAYDHYCGQTYLDNVMRGGLPLCMGHGKKPFIFYAYSRKHGDLERDYNRFLLEDSYFAQGDGNYRDVNQNRRNDVWFEPRVEDANIKTFMNLIQLDGFNPLVVKGVDVHFKRTPVLMKTLSRYLGRKNAQGAADYLKDCFKLGEFYRWLESHGGMTPARFAKMFTELESAVSVEQKAEHGEGFWTDHWTYNIDLIESYLAIYPERLSGLLFDGREYTFYDNDHRVRPRNHKYYWLETRGARQYKAVFKDSAKTSLLLKRKQGRHLARGRGGKGEIYRTTLFVKLLCLFANKFASLDASGTGMEMEADKPSWYDSLNGLPGLAGSSLPETFELKRLAVFLIHSLDDARPEPGETASFPVELFDFIAGLEKLLDKHLHDKFRSKGLEFWNDATSFKEKFRDKIAMGLTGSEKKIDFFRLRTFLERCREKIEVGLQKAHDEKTGLFPTYYENTVTKFKRLGEATSTGQKVLPAAFEQKPLPVFLEAMVHAFKVEKDPEKRRSLFRAVKRSPLYDAKLSMYKVNGPLNDCSYEIGRTRVFSPGWLENESVWLHMEYKYLLEVLKAGMHEEFFQDFKKALIPFQPAERYGRSILENSSFIVSSVFPDPSVHGTGFVARLSGSTAEFLNMWLVMNVGKRPFIVGPDGKVSLRFEPTLPAFLFTQKETVRVMVEKNGDQRAVRVPKDSLAFMFLGKTMVVYHNPRCLDTFGKLRVSIKRILVKDSRGNVAEFKGDTVSSPLSLKVRDERIPRIDIELG